MVHHDHHHSTSERVESGEIPNVANEASVIEALDSVRAVEDPQYVKAILESYVNNKRKQGDSDEEISKKLLFIQQRFPHYVAMADQVRNELGLKQHQT